MDKLNLYHELEQLLRKNSRYCMDDGRLLKNRIVEDALSIQPLLVKELLGNEKMKKVFFTDVEGVMVFDKIKFQRFVSDTQFLGGSYTMFKNKIGLANENGRFVSESREVVLSWPYKDCMLEGGQTKEDAKRNEVFWNETLAPDEVNRLTEPKVFSNFKRYDKEGEHQVDHLSDNDNLIIKGNNLLALHSLKKKYAGQVKLIYIDPPYNTGSDEFGYNDSFNHSSWLTFMKNRLEVARMLLSDEGSIFVHIDHHELYYIGALLDSIFGVENKVQVISVKTATPAGFKTVNPGPIDVTEYILFYTKHKNSFNFKKAYVPVGYNVNYNLVLEKNEDILKWKFTPIKDAMLQSLGFKTEKEAKAFLREVNADANKLKSLLETGVSLRAFSEIFLREKAKEDMKPTAYRTLELNVGRVCDKLGHVMLRDIDSDLVQQLVFDLGKEGYSKSVMEKSKIVIGSMLKMAAAKHYLDTVPVLDIRISSPLLFSLCSKL